MTTYQSTSPASNHQASEPGDSPSLVDILAPVAPEIALVEEYLVTNLIDDTVFIANYSHKFFRLAAKESDRLLLCCARKRLQKNKIVN